MLDSSDSLPKQLDSLPDNWAVLFHDAVTDVLKFRLRVSSVVIPFSWHDAVCREFDYQQTGKLFGEPVIFGLVDAPVAAFSMKREVKL